VATVREEDTVARLGGDEFIIALWHVSGTDDAAKVALKVIEAVSQPYGIEGHTVSVTTSAGIGIYPVHGEDADTLMKSADLALYDGDRDAPGVCERLLRGISTSYYLTMLPLRGSLNTTV
jgi:two-component system, cell cycle response regulator